MIDNSKITCALCKSKPNITESIYINICKCKSLKISNKFQQTYYCYNENYFIIYNNWYYAYNKLNIFSTFYYPTGLKEQSKSHSYISLSNKLELADYNINPIEEVNKCKSLLLFL